MSAKNLLLCPLSSLHLQPFPFLVGPSSNQLTTTSSQDTGHLVLERSPQLGTLCRWTYVTRLCLSIPSDMLSKRYCFRCRLWFICIYRRLCDSPFVNCTFRDAFIIIIINIQVRQRKCCCTANGKLKIKRENVDDDDDIFAAGVP